MPFSRGSSNPGIEPGSSALQEDSLPYDFKCFQDSTCETTLFCCKVSIGSMAQESQCFPVGGGWVDSLFFFP